MDRTKRDKLVIEWTDKLEKYEQHGLYPNWLKIAEQIVSAIEQAEKDGKKEGRREAMNDIVQRFAEWFIDSRFKVELKERGQDGQD